MPLTKWDVCAPPALLLAVPFGPPRRFFWGWSSPDPTCFFSCSGPGFLLVSVSSLKRAPRGSRAETDGAGFLFSWGPVKWAQRPCKMHTSGGSARLHSPACRRLPSLPACLPAPGLPRELPGPGLWGRPQPPPPRAREAPARPRASVCNVCRYVLTPSPASPELTRSHPPQGPPGRLLAHRAWRLPRRGIPLTPGRRPSWPRPRHNTMWARGLGRPGRALTPLMRGCTPG